MRLLDSVLEKFASGDLPNKFTLEMGELIRKAREQAGFSQRELAERIFRRQAALSDMENGKMEPNSSTLVYLAFNLKKPISYFFPMRYKPDKMLEELSDLDKELIFYSVGLNDNDKIKIIAQLKALSRLQEDT